MAKLTPTQRCVFIACIICLGGGLFGFDTGSIGAQTVMSSFQKEFGVLEPIIQGLVVSIILPASALSGFMAGPVSDKISRKRTVSLGALIFAAGSAISAGAKGPSLTSLYIGRAITGLGEGFILGTGTTYLTECAPRGIRGKVILLFQLFTTGAVAAGFFVCYGSVKISSSLGWRLPFAIQCVSALALAIAAPLLPYSPRWLISKGRHDEANAVLDLLVEPADEADRKELLKVPPEALAGSRRAALLAIFAKDVRGRTLYGIFLNCFQQLAGIDFVLFYSPLLFAQAGLDPETSSFVASGVTGLILVACTAAGYFYIDRVGRRTLFVGGGAATSATLYILGFLYLTGAARTASGKWASIVFIELFAVSFASSWSIVVRAYTSEIQPNRTRAAATSVGQALNQLLNAVVALTGPEFLARSSYGPYFLYASFTAFACIVTFFTMKETRGASLETIDKSFEDGPTYVVKWPSALSRLPFLSASTELRARKNSRSGSTQLAGESRAEFRAHVAEMELDAIRE